MLVRRFHQALCRESGCSGRRNLHHGTRVRTMTGTTIIGGQDTLHQEEAAPSGCRSSTHVNAKREAPDADAITEYDDDRAGVEGLRDLRQVRQQDQRESLRINLLTAEEHKTWTTVVGPRQQLAEVGVSRHQHPVLYTGGFHHDDVGRTGKSKPDDGHGIMTSRGELCGQQRRQALVDEEPHALRCSGSSRSATAAAA